jgi:hypothetical protein
MIKIADQLGQTDPEELAAMMHLLPSRMRLQQATIEFLGKLQARAKAMHRERPLLINTAQGTRLRRPDFIDAILERQRTRAKMTRELADEEFAGGSQR